jgi:hypothetical protein
MHQDHEVALKPSEFIIVVTGFVVLGRSCESQDGFDLSIVVVVFLSHVILSIDNGMPFVEGGLFAYFPNRFPPPPPVLLVFVDLCECICIYRNSDVKV